MESRNKLAMCRLCLCENQCFVNIFEVNDWQGYVAAEVICDLLQFQVSETDVYPHVVCSKCLVKLTDFKLFKECCQKSKVSYDNMFVQSGSLEEHKAEMVEFVTVKVEPICYSDDEDDDSKVQVVDADTATYIQNLHCLEHKVPHCSSKGALGAPEENMYMDTLIQHNIGIEMVEKDGNREENETEEELDGGKGTAPEKDAEGDSNMLECCHCGIMFTTKKVLMHHMKKEHGFHNSYDDTICGKVFLSNSHLKNHDLIHTGTKLYKCEECSKGFNKNSLLKRHMRYHTGNSPFKCGECGKCYSDNSNLKTHMMSHTGSKPFKCSECSKSFSNNNNLKRHMRLHTGSKPYKCAECSKCFSQYSSLKIHIRSHSGSKPYTCAECSKSFSSDSNLKKHLRLHTGSKPYKCAECSKSFSDNSNLKGHMMSHAGVKPYKCNECSKSFTQNSSLTKHIRLHTGSKPYRCTECSKSFSDSSNLKGHMRLHTGSKPYNCADCSKSFSKNFNLKMHMRTHRL